MINKILPCDVFYTFFSFDPKTACGLDGISSYVLKNCPSESHLLTD